MAIDTRAQDITETDYFIFDFTSYTTRGAGSHHLCNRRQRAKLGVKVWRLYPWTATQRDRGSDLYHPHCRDQCGRGFYCEYHRER